MVGDAAEVCLSGEALFARLADFPVVMLDALPTSRHPMKPRSLLAISARQLSSYGGSLETAVTDLEHYRNTGSAVLVLCGGEVRANNLLRLLEERNIPAVLDLEGSAPQCGTWYSLRWVLCPPDASTRPCSWRC